MSTFESAKLNCVNLKLSEKQYDSNFNTSKVYKKSKDSSDRYKKKTKKTKTKQRKVSKRVGGRCQDLSKEEKLKSDNMVANDIKIFLEMKNKGYLSIEKIL